MKDKAEQKKSKYPKGINEDKLMYNFITFMQKEKEILKKADESLREKINKHMPENNAVEYKKNQLNETIGKDHESAIPQNKRRLSFMFEIQKSCNNKCIYCYNVWKADKSFSYSETDTKTIKKIIHRLKDQADPREIIITGGEPLLREDFLEILTSLDNLEINSTLITNSILLTEDLIKKCISKRVRKFQIPLLSQSSEIHNELQGNESWGHCVDAIMNIKKHGGNITPVFVATRKNIGTIKETMEFAISLGADSFMFNRFNVGGEGLRYAKELMPNILHLRLALEIVNKLSNQYNIPVHSTIPVQPCLIDMTAYNRLGYGFCNAGGDQACIYAVDGFGNIRPCTHTKKILGNILDQALEDILKSTENRKFRQAHPKICEGCPWLNQCMGGCKAAAEVCFNDICSEEPFLRNNIEKLKNELQN